jgi:hypothetical protein
MILAYGLEVAGHLGDTPHGGQEENNRLHNMENNCEMSLSILSL